MTRWPAYAMITISIILMQWHSITFWMDQTGVIGFFWSLAIEGWALWFWWQHKTKLAIIASTLLICGPLHQLSNPLIEQLQSGTQHHSLIKITRGEVAQLSASLKEYQARSEERTGWSRRIDNTQLALNVARDELKAQVIKPAAAEMPWRNQAIIAVQLLVLLVVLTGQIQAVVSLRMAEPVTQSRKRRNVAAKPFAAKGAEANISATISEPAPTVSIETIVQALDNALAETGLTQGKWADANNISRKGLSLVRNHIRLSNEGKETAAATTILKVTGALGITAGVAQ